jgi:hypothetical protein
MLEDLILALNFLCILLLGAITSFEDIKNNKIRNTYIACALLFGICTNVLLPIIAEGSWYFVSIYLMTTLINAIMALVAGFALWYSKIWRAGDGKLFFAYAFLLPITVYHYGYLPYFLSFSLLINILTIVFFLLCLNLWIITSTDEKLEILKNSTNPKQLFYMLTSLISTQWLLSILFRQLLPTADVLTTGLISIVLLTFLTNRYQNAVYKASIPIMVLRILVDFGTMASYSFISQLAILFILFVVVVNFITNLGSFRFTERVKIVNLKPRACCTEKIIRKEGSYTKSSTSGKIEEVLKLNYEDLTDADIKKLNLLHKRGRLKFKELTIRQTIPFAPFLLLGVLLTILIRGDVIAYSSLIVLRYLIQP